MVVNFTLKRKTEAMDKGVSISRYFMQLHWDENDKKREFFVRRSECKSKTYTVKVYPMFCKYGHVQ